MPSASTTDGLGTFQVNDGAGSPFNVKQVVLSAFNIAGDFNTDGKVDAADYALWRHTTGATVPRYTSADADGSGTIDQADYTICSLPLRPGGRRRLRDRKLCRIRRRPRSAPGCFASPRGVRPLTRHTSTSPPKLNSALPLRTPYSATPYSLS